MLEEVKKSLESSPVVKKGDYNYFVNPISDGVPTMKPEMLRELAEVVKEHVDMNIDKIVAIEAMGIHLATALSLATNIPFVIIRKRQYGLEGEKEIKQKTGYGSSKLYINDLKAGERILLIDDVVSTGGTLISTLDALKELDIDIKSAVAVIEKGEGKKLVEEETGIPIFSVVKLDVVDGKVVIEKTIAD
ncbi:hypoxanthine/guanine phosphoribosyltransferase [uncultured Methanobrevibacter sp.]|uniref:hypoxanthine/guanine phosphoribosyltransferase n=1 Tax=uncultured Methanobrevibacter sp. TaxID=253161 RepID=UPI002619FF56|nr:hypoxanthine/guanine phosphoribosyltransferase [uncultured Methanobrevibacter sp.]